MKKINNDKGYALLIVIAILSIFTILGLSLMSITTSGIAKNKSRQDVVQATDLSEKGTQYMANDIQAFLENELNKSGGKGKDAFKTLLNTTFNNDKYLCSKNNGFTIPGENGSETKVCIESVVPLNTITNNDKDQLKVQVTFKSTGIVNGKEKTITTKMIFGSDAVPDQLKYAISTNQDGNLFLHGGVEIQGDVKTDGNIILSEQATWFSGDTPKWQDSVLARIVKGTNSATPKLIMNSNKNLYVLKTNNKPTYTEHINGSKLSETARYSKLSPTTSNASNIFSNTFFSTENLQVVTRELPDDNVEITNTVSNKYNKTSKKYMELSISSNTTNGNPLKSLSKSTEVYIGEEEYCSRWFIVCLETKKRKAKTYLSVNGNGSEINLTGQIYLYGNLKIDSTKLKSDALIYVDGNVEISNSTLNGISDNSTLIIFATGDIDIYNISVDKPNPSIIKGFFYTKKDMLMYGVGSNIELHGGISAKRLILTAVRGTSNNNSWLSKDVQDDIENGEPKYTSRLKVIYDQNLISQYTDFKRDEESEIITELSPPQTIERKY